MMRPATTVLVVALLAVVGFPFDADACSRPGGEPSREKLVADAEEIFVARVVVATERPLPAEPDEPREAYIEARYDLVEVLKGDVARDGVVHADVMEMCDLGLIPGWNYLFLIDHDAAETIGGIELRPIGDSMPIGPFDDELADNEDLAEVRRILQTTQKESER